MMKYFSERESNYFIRKYEVNGEWGFILMIWDERELNFQMPFRDLWSELREMSFFSMPHDHDRNDPTRGGQ